MAGRSRTTVCFILFIGMHCGWIGILKEYDPNSYLSACQATSFVSPGTSKNNYTEFIRVSCNSTLYPHLCYKSMSKFAEKVQASPKLLANTSISVTLKEAKSTFLTMKNMSKYKGLSVGERAALRDCVEVTDDSVYELQRSMDQMDHMDDGTTHFDFEISNVQTWVSAALTDYTTCMDGFYNVNEGKVKAKARKYAMNVSQLTSISLAFINRYANSGYKP
ncbi:hypothetical protein ACET3Z_008561 [Daucus carota]